MKLKTINLSGLREEESKEHRFNAQYDLFEVVVYQAFNSEIADYAVQNQRFGGSFSFNRRSWIKTGFFWMMYRSGWGQKSNQERILAIHLDRGFFDDIVSEAVPSQPSPHIYTPFGLWKEEYYDDKLRQKAANDSDVVIQLDPDRTFQGNKCGRRAIQLGLCRQKLREYAQDRIQCVEDISDFVREQYQYLQSGNYDQMCVPIEKAYLI